MGLSAWFVFTAIDLFKMGTFIGGATAVGLSFLAVFMLKALFFKSQMSYEGMKEIKQEDEPKLFGFLHKLADEAKAPRPKKVFLSNRVNASVFYDLSFFNLFFPSKKNLEIGLGLINVLNVGELKAVLAHEFGHFAQRSMLIGRYVYIAQKIAGHIVGKRDALDTFLSGLSRIDLRIAWIGWLLSILVWSIRAITDTLFSIVVIAERALSREMEFHADLMAVSLTGSDAIVHGLHRLRAADEGFQIAMNFANQKLHEKKAVTNIYELQSNIITHRRRVLNQEDYGEALRIKTDSPDGHRVFKSHGTRPPEMWATHPDDFLREENAKRHYIGATIDDRSSWELFTNPEETQIAMTKILIDSAKMEDLEPIASPEAISEQNDEYNKIFLNTEYRGAYLSRYLFRGYNNPEEAYTSAELGSNVSANLQNLYPESLGHDLEALRDLEEELELLEALKKDVFSAQEGVITHRGETMKRKKLPEIMEQVKEEVTQARQKIWSHDRKCRAAHLQACSSDWQEYLKSLGTLIHYAEHNEARISHLRNQLNALVAIVLADGKVSSSELDRVLAASNQLYAALHAVHSRSNEVQLSKPVVEKLTEASWKEELGEFGLVSVNADNINEWMKVIDGWVDSTNHHLNNLRIAALEELLTCEAKVKTQYLNKSSESGYAPSSNSVPESYARLLLGDEDDLQHSLTGWDKFITATGIVPTVTRLAVAASLIGGTIFLSGSIGTSDLIVYNGLGTSVILDYGGIDRRIASNDYYKTDWAESDELTISIYDTNHDNLIETFKPEYEGRNNTYVYNVASAASFYKLKIPYSYIPTSRSSTPVDLGNPQWLVAETDYQFTEPPSEISMSSSSGVTYKSLLDAYSTSASQAVTTISETNDQQNLIRTHCKWDESDSRNILDWAALATELPDFEDLMNSRLQRNPEDIVAIRALQDAAEGNEKEKICAEHLQKSKEQPKNVNWYYAKCRCISDEKEQDVAFLKGHEVWPDHPWLAFASAYTLAHQEKWLDALNAMRLARTELPALEENLLIGEERIRRIIGSTEETQELIADENSEYISFMNLIETGSNSLYMEKNPYYAYVLMQKGKLDEAVTYAGPHEEVRDAIIIMAAASNGASEKLKERAFDLLENGSADLNTLWYGIALSLKEKGTYNSDELKTATGDAFDNVQRFISLIRSGDFAKAEKLDVDLGIKVKAQLRTMAILLRPNDVPEDWKSFVEKALFPIEKPYLGPAISS